MRDPPGSLARRAHDPSSRSQRRSPRCACTAARNVPLDGGLVLALNHFSVDRPVVVRRGLAADDLLHGEGRAYRAPVDGPADPLVRRLLLASSPRRVRPRSDPPRASSWPRGRAVGLFVEGTRQKSGVPGEPKSGASMIALPGARPRRPGGDPRQPVLAARQLPPGLGRLGRADGLRRPAGETARATARPRRRFSAARSGRSGTSSSTCTSSARRSTLRRLPFRCAKRLETRAEQPAHRRRPTLPRHGRDRRLPQRGKFDAHQSADRNREPRSCTRCRA